MHHFTIRDIENLSGIKAHTLRMWEQRYGICVCKRKESLHRYYDNEDLKHILRIAYLYHNGYRISRIAKLSEQEILQLASRRQVTDEYEVIVNQLLEASVDYNQEEFENVFHAAVRTMGLEKSIEKVVFPFMNKIGLLWMTGHVLPAQEHFCSHLIQKTIIASTNALPSVKAGNCRVLLFTPDGEDRELPLLFVQYLLKKKGVKTIFLGTNVAADILRFYCAHQPVTHLYFHRVTNFNNALPADYFADLSDSFAQMKIVASGQVLQDIATLPANVVILHSLQEMMEFQFSN